MRLGAEDIARERFIFHYDIRLRTALQQLLHFSIEAWVVGESAKFALLSGWRIVAARTITTF